MSRYLFISDLQIPFEHSDALRFCRFLQKEFKIPAENVYCVGDELDQYFGSRFPKDPDSNYSALSEIKESVDKLRTWYSAFPLMKIAVSNHGMRWAKRAFEAQMPSQMLIPYQKIIQAPRGWRWQERWVIKAKYPMLMIHGTGYSGMYAHKQAAIDENTRLIMGHLHTNGGVTMIRTATQTIWGLATGCLIDEAAFAFHYSKHQRYKGILGAGVVLDDGATPLFIPMGEV